MTIHDWAALTGYAVWLIWGALLGILGILAWHAAKEQIRVWRRDAREERMRRIRENESLR